MGPVIDYILQSCTGHKGFRPLIDLLVDLFALLALEEILGRLSLLLLYLAEVQQPQVRKLECNVFAIVRLRGDGVHQQTQCLQFGQMCQRLQVTQLLQIVARQNYRFKIWNRFL